MQIIVILTIGTALCYTVSLTMTSSDDDISLALVAKRLKVASSDDDMSLALVRKLQRKSEKAFNREFKENKHHEKALDRIILVNECVRVSVPKDGHCLMSAVLKQVCSNELNIKVMRGKISDHFLSNLNSYRAFLPSGFNILKTIEKFRRPGYWNDELTDAVPLAIANLFQKNFIIDTSVKTVIEIQPNMQLLPLIKLPTRNILLAHPRIPGRDHYDCVFHKSQGNCLT